jgi:hypothetical protein
VPGPIAPGRSTTGVVGLDALDSSLLEIGMPVLMGAASGVFSGSLWEQRTSLRPSGESGLLVSHRWGDVGPRTDQDDDAADEQPKSESWKSEANDECGRNPKNDFEPADPTG